MGACHETIRYSISINQINIRVYFVNTSNVSNIVIQYDRISYDFYVILNVNCISLYNTIFCGR